MAFIGQHSLDEEFVPVDMRAHKIYDEGLGQLPQIPWWSGLVGLAIVWWFIWGGD